MYSHHMTLTKSDIDWLIDSMKLIFPTKDESTHKFDKVMKKLDTFIGEIKASRESQELHQGQHNEITDRLDTIEKHVGITA